MSNFDPKKLSEWANSRWKGRVKRPITGFSIDTRNLRPGELFVALKTPRRDGHDFLVHATQRGASGAIVSKVNPHIGLPQLPVDDPLDALQTIAARWRQEFDGPVIGITGSVGKTSTRDLLALLLGEEGVHRTRENFNNQIGVPLSLLAIFPDRHRCAVVEAGSSAPGELEILAKIIDATASLITGVTPTHLEGFGTVEQIAREKAYLGCYTRPDGSVIFPHYCTRFSSFDNFPATSIILAPENTSGPINLPASQVVYWTEKRGSTPAGGCRLTLRQSPHEEKRFELPPVSPGMVCNAALAIVMAGQMGVSDRDIQDRLNRWQPASLRGEIIQCGKTLYYVDCYNASPASMVDAFASFELNTPPEMPRLYVLGCMAELGRQSAELHREVGQQLKMRPGDKALICGEDAASLRQGLLYAGNLEDQLKVLETPEEARPELSSFEGSVLLKGSRAYRLETLLPATELNLEVENKKAC